MIKGRTALLGAALSAALAASAGAVKAQDYYSTPHSLPADNSDYYQRTYDRALGNDAQTVNGVETVIVRPYYDDVEKHQVIGRVDGEINPTAYSLSRPVDLSDLDLSRSPDRAELRIRVHEAALDLCAELEDRVPALRNDRSASQRCVREAAGNAMRDVMERRG